MNNTGLPNHDGTMPRPLNVTPPGATAEGDTPPTVPPPPPPVQPIGFTMGFAAQLRRQGVPTPEV